ncbi:MAG TPA: hypothetical protein VMZ69_11555 [Saprospiraceae bacterium]|nr:hypothetical protein [Saprospiraceae bacterium]
MRKLAFYTMTICLLFTFCITDVKAVNSTPNNSAIVAEKPSEEVQAMIDRVQEIKAMDLSTLAPAERKALKKELRTIKQEMKAVSGIYLSIGALIIIVILLILLL